MTMPSSEDLLQFHYECLQGMYFSEHLTQPGGDLLFSDKIRDPYYNFFAPKGSQVASPLDDAMSSEFSNRDREPVIYMTPSIPQERQSELMGSGTVWATDAWLVGNTSEVISESSHPSRHVTVKQVDAEERDTYVDVFRISYSGDDPGDPYGQLDAAYVTSLYDSFGNDSKGYAKTYAMAYVDDRPVGVAVLLTKGELAGVYGVGTIPSQRKAGIGTALMGFVASEAEMQGARHVFLQTEQGSKVQSWYERQGYIPVFSAPYLRLASTRS